MDFKNIQIIFEGRITEVSCACVEIWDLKGEFEDIHELIKLSAYMLLSNW